MDYIIVQRSQGMLKDRKIESKDLTHTLSHLLSIIKIKISSLDHKDIFSRSWFQQLVTSSKDLKLFSNPPLSSPLFPSLPLSSPLCPSLPLSSPFFPSQNFCTSLNRGGRSEEREKREKREKREQEKKKKKERRMRESLWEGEREKKNKIYTR